MQRFNADGSRLGQNCASRPTTASKVGTNIQDANGALMDENGNAIKGESTDVFLAQFTLASSVTAAFPMLAAPSRTGNGQFQFEFTGPAGSNYVIQASTNFTAWIPIAKNVLPVSGVIPITDPFATNYSQRFYRAVSQ